MVEWGGGAVLAGAIDVGGAPPRRRVGVRPDRASLLIGHDVSAADVAESLGRIGIATEKQDGTVLAEVPGFRPDVEREEDLIEEIARVQGYDRLRSTLPGIRQAGSVAATYAFRRRLRAALVRAGTREALTLTFASSADLELMGHTEAVRVQNPPSADEPFLRRSLVPNLLEALQVTLRRGGTGAAVFEVGHVFHPADPVDEREVLAVVMAGPATTGPHAEPRAFDVFDAKGVLESVMSALGVERWDVGAAAGPPMHPGRSARVEIDGVGAGAVGELLGSCALFDVHTGPPLPAGTKSLAFSVDLRASDRTLTDAEAGEAVESIVERLARDFGARLRSA
jgi:phenylalanyl-tRNA synthetase beta chain